jgi:hypothetical protein
MLLLWLGTCTLSIFPELHRLLHTDAQSPTHHCLATQFQQHSSVPELAPAIGALAPPLVICDPLKSELQFCSSFDYRLSPSRAPPSI